MCADTKTEVDSMTKTRNSFVFSLCIRRTICSYSWIGFVWCHSRTRQESQSGLSGPIYVCFIHVRMHSLRVARHCLSVECFCGMFQLLIFVRFGPKALKMQMQMQLQAIFFSFIVLIYCARDEVHLWWLLCHFNACTHTRMQRLNEDIQNWIGFALCWFFCVSLFSRSTVDETLRLFDHLLCLSLSTKIVEHHFNAFVFGSILTMMKTNFSIQKAKISGRQLSQLKRPALQ